MSDGTGNDDSTGTVSISITAVDDPPVAESRSLTVAEDSSGTNLGLLEPTTPDPGETLVITVTQVPLSSEGVIDNAGASLAASSTLTPSELAALKFIPATDYDGTVTDFSYSLSDGTGADASNGTVTITITPVDDPPVAESKSVTVNEDSPGTNLGLLTPTTPDTGETLNITINQVPTAGEGIISNAGIALAVSNAITPSELAGLSFVPNSNYDGTVTDFVYTLSDATGNDDSQGIVTITITPQNDAPVAIDDVFATNEGAPSQVVSLPMTLKAMVLVLTLSLSMQCTGCSLLAVMGLSATLPRRGSVAQTALSTTSRTSIMSCRVHLSL